MNFYFNINGALALSRTFFLLMLTVILSLPLWSDQVSFVKEVAPILQSKCAGCHDDETSEGGYRVDSFNLLQRAGDSEKSPIVPGASDKSELFLRLIVSDESTRMPAESDPLSAKEIETIKQWIDNQAPFDGPSLSASISSLLRRIHPSPPETYRQPIPVSAIATTKAGVVIAGYHELLVRSFDGKLTQRIDKQVQRTYSIRKHPVKQRLLTAGGTPGEYGEVRIVGDDIDDVIVRSDEVIMDATFSPDAAHIAVAMPDGTIRILDTRTREVTQVLSGHSDAVMSVNWHHDSNRFLSTSIDHTAKMFDVTKRRSMTTFSGHTGVVNQVDFGANDTQAISVGSDGAVYLWKTNNGRKERDLHRQKGPIHALAVTKDYYFAVGQGLLRGWQRSSHNPMSQYAASTTQFTSAAHADDTLVVGTMNGTIMVLQIPNLELQTQFQAFPQSLPD